MQAETLDALVEALIPIVFGPPAEASGNHQNSISPLESLSSA